MDRCLTGTCSSRLLVKTSVRKNLVDKVGTREPDGEHDEVVADN